MKNPIVASSLVFTLACLPINPAWAAPPIEEEDPQSNGYQSDLKSEVKKRKGDAREIARKDKKKASDAQAKGKVEDDKKKAIADANALANREGPLYFLSIKQKTRIEAVKPLVVPMEPLHANDAAKTLADACERAPKALALPSKTGILAGPLDLKTNDLRDGTFSRDLLAQEHAASPPPPSASPAASTSSRLRKFGLDKSPSDVI